MGTAVMMYVLPMLLGQTYDLGKEKPGLQIFPISVEQDTQEIQHYFTDSQYRMVENAAQVKDFLSISGKLSLKIKSGLVDVNGEGSYLKDRGFKTNAVEILVKVHFETITKTIPSWIKPNADWSTINEQFLGTHYCRSITYGGDLVASIRISADSNFDLENIKGAINGDVNAKAFESSIKGKLELLKQNAQDSSSMEINYYATVPLHGVSYDIDGLMKLVDEFPQHVKKVNDGIGNPLRMELYPLNSIKEGWPSYLENIAIIDELDDMEAQFDDLRETRRKVGVWVENLPPLIPENVERKITEFTDKLNDIFSVYMQSIEDLDTSKGASTLPISRAFDAYSDNDYILPYKYIRKLSALQKEIYGHNPELKPRVGGAEYIRWGRSDCSTKETEASVVGIMATSEAGKDGASSQFMCSPLEPTRVEVKEYFPGYPGEHDPDDNLLVSPVRYMGELQRFKSAFNKQVACVHCRASLRTAVLMKVATHKCPSEKWTKEYDGYLMAPGKESHKGEFVCVDRDLTNPIGAATFGNSIGSHLQEIQEVTADCGSLPCATYESGRAIPCIVCTI